MSDKQLAEIICRALLAIVSALRKKYGLKEEMPGYVVLSCDNVTLPPEYRG